LMNPKTGGVFASFGGHPSFEVALERSLTELLQGRSFEGLNDLPRPTFDSLAVTEPENFVEHFIDSSGVISWRFFSDKHDYEFVEWDFSSADGSSAADGSTGTSEEEADRLFALLKDIGKESYMAVFDIPSNGLSESDIGKTVGPKACRILVPDYSEVYPVEDLIWDNTNKALDYREDILNIHSLSTDALIRLYERLEESQQDNYTDIRTMIGIDFDENTVWGQLTILELKILICLAIGEHEEALELVSDFLQFNDNTVERGLFYQAVHAVLEIELADEMELADYTSNLTRMFGEENMTNVIGSVSGDIKFFGLTKTSMKLEGLDKHLRLIESYKKLHSARMKTH